MSGWDPEQVLEHGAFVRALARDLVAGAADVDDLVQESWLRALSKPAGAGFSPRAWLAGIVRNVARERRRSQARRERRRSEAIEALSSTAATRASTRDDDPAALAERFDLVRRVLSWVDELPELHRRALLLRYLDGLDPAEIARRDGVPDATVRSWIKRGLDELRARLDAGHGGERAAWIGALLPWTLSAARGAASATTAGAGGAVVKTTNAVAWGAVALVIAAAIGVRWAWMRAPALAEPPASAVAAGAGPDALANPALARASDGLAAADRIEARRDATPPAAAATGLGPKASPSSDCDWRLEGSIAGVDHAIPWTGSVRIAGVASDLSDEESLQFDAKVERDGTFAAALPGLSPQPASHRWRGMKVVASDPAYVDVEGFVDALDEHGQPCAGPRTFHVELQTRPAALVHGRVVDERGSPLAAMFVSWAQWNGHEGEGSTRSDARGEYRLTSAEIGPAKLCCSGRDPEVDENAHEPAEAGADRLGAEVAVELKGGIDVEAPDLVLRKGAAIAGFVVDEAGDAIGGALVRGTFDVAAPIPSDAGRRLHAVRDAVCDEDGAFRLDGLAPGRWKLRVVGIRGMPAHCVVSNEDELGTMDVDAPSDVVELVSKLSRLELRVQFQGQPVPNLVLSIQGTQKNGDSSVLGGRSDGDGRFVFLGLPGCRYQTWVDRDDFEKVTPPFTLADDEHDRVVTLDLEARRPRPSLQVRLHDPKGEPIGRAWFELTPVAPTAASPREFRLDNGADGADPLYLLKEIDPATYHVRVRAGGGYYGSGGFFQEEEFDVVLSEPVVVERSITVRPTGRLLLFAVDARGNGIAARCTVRSLDGREIPVAFTYESAQSAGRSPRGTFDDEHAFVTPSPPPGRYLLEFSADGFAPQTVEREVVEGQTTDVVVTLER